MAQKILIIEDDQFLREIIVRKLEGEEFKVSEAIDGESGLIKIKEEKPDLLLLDLILPNMGGFEVLEKIKKDPALKSIPVIILSNLGQKEEIEKGIQLGAAAYLIKAHVTPKEILEKMKTILK